MGKILQLLVKFLGEARGNATYDFIRTQVVPMILSFSSLLVNFIRQAPWWQIWTIFAIVWLITVLVQRHKKQTAKEQSDPDAPFQPDARVRNLFTKMVDSYKQQAKEISRDAVENYVSNLQPPNPICEVIAVANEIQTEKELEWYCNEFVKHHYEHPLKVFQDTLKTEWLPVLVEARHSPKQITKTVEFCDFLIVRWSGNEKWKEANRRRNSGLSIHNTNSEVMPEFIPESGSVSLHRCSKCGYSFKIKNPLHTAYTQAGVVTVACKECGHVDEVGMAVEIKEPDLVGPNSDLEIEFVPCVPKPAKNHPCQIRICNKSSTKNADNLKVEIVSFTDDLSLEPAKYYHPDLPYLLKPDSQNNTINPLDAKVITAFYFEGSSQIQGIPQKFVCAFDLGKPNEKKYATFQEKKDYQIKFAASAGGMARIEKGFKMTFSSENGIGRINLKSE